MKHYIIVKWKEGTDKTALLAPVKAVFEETLAIPGIRGVRLIPNCVDRPNRYDLMIEIEMDREALPVYDESAAHKKWKETYGGMIASKTIFDAEM